jgi:hypothetical protein
MVQGHNEYTILQHYGKKQKQNNLIKSYTEI